MVILAASARLVAVDAIPIRFPVKLEAVTIPVPVNNALPLTVSADVAFVVPMPTLLVVLIPVGYVTHCDEVPPVADIVAIPEPKETDKLDVKSIVPAVPTVELLFLITIPVPDAVILEREEPSP